MGIQILKFKTLIKKNKNKNINNSSPSYSITASAVFFSKRESPKPFVTRVRLTTTISGNTFPVPLTGDFLWLQGIKYSKAYCYF